MSRAVAAPWRTAVCLSLSAAVAEQVLHESVHGVVALLVGKQWQALHLFAFASKWPATPSIVGDAWVAASAAVFNIVTGLGAAFVLARKMLLASRPFARLWLLYFAAFSILAGFGYLMIDAAFYRPGAVGDWKRVIGVLGGGWAVRGPVLAVGVSGVFAAFFWIPRAALEFIGTGEGRLRSALALLLAPFVAVCGSMTLLAIGHPLGASGVALTAIKHWMGYSALAWAPFIAAGMAKKQPDQRPRTRILAAPPRAWVSMLVALLAQRLGPEGSPVAASNSLLLIRACFAHKPNCSIRSSHRAAAVPVRRPMCLPSRAMRSIGVITALEWPGRWSRPGMGSPRLV